LNRFIISILLLYKYAMIYLVICRIN
jgi:hypothetical protein